LCARVGKVQGRNHGLKFGASQNNFSSGEGRRAGGAQVQFGTPNFFSFYPILILIVVTNKTGTGSRSDTNVLGNVRGTY